MFIKLSKARGCRWHEGEIYIPILQLWNFFRLFDYDAPGPSESMPFHCVGYFPVLYAGYWVQGC